MDTSKVVNGQLKQALGLPSLIAVGVGIVVSQGCFLTVLQGVGIKATVSLPAILIAFILTICYVFTFSELSLIMPKAGSISTYTEVAIGHFSAIRTFIGVKNYAGSRECYRVLYFEELEHDTNMCLFKINENFGF